MNYTGIFVGEAFAKIIEVCGGVHGKPLPEGFILELGDREKGWNTEHKSLNS